MVCSTSPDVSLALLSTLTTTRWKPLSSFHSMTRAAIHTFDQHLDVAVRELEALHHVGDTTHREHIFGAGIVDGRVVLGRQEDPLVLGQRMLERADGRRPTDDERHHHVWKNDDVSERDDWERFVDFDHSWCFWNVRDAAVMPRLEPGHSANGHCCVVSVWGESLPAGPDVSPGVAIRPSQ